ncbi:zinc-finger domain-containing protein [Flexibacterium corallicola]|uniref:zinc-finger domain-containing protein n=1 Tax=Flexibacterium corallicola TaxID=3037259 RepID=UPI00286EEF1B|nr:zinc-finger domain-containing protein [Pseudovibrio sp. M1P-2-3]
MAEGSTPHFHNNSGQESIVIGAKEFMCIGSKPPFDHPHIFLDMGSEKEIVCPYCSTLYKYDSNLNRDQSDPADSLWTPATS